jgi:hypothetical protein
MLPDYGECQVNTAAADRYHITGLAVLRTCFLQAETHPDQKLLLVGHADTSGDAAGNLTLSRLRARNVLAVIEGDRDGWVGISEKRHKVEDYQQILRWVAQDMGWDCDPGPIDGIKGSQTKGAVERFQRRYNESFGKSIRVDGDVGRETWGAIFDLYRHDLAELLATDEAGLLARRDALVWLDAARRAVGCGENHPIEAPERSNYRSETNRRVEILFFKKEDDQKLPCHPTSETCNAKSCEIYGPGSLYGRTYLPCTPALPSSLALVRVDDHFASSAENLEIAYALRGLADKPVKLEISSEQHPGRKLFELELGAADKSDGEHVLQWDGQCNAAGEMKDRFAHPLLSPYRVRLYHDDKLTSEREFKVLYHSIALRCGPWTPDEKAPPESDEKAWVQYRLNELGYWGGPMGHGDFDGYLSKAIIRYKANHASFHQLDYSKYDDSITPALKDALRRGDGARSFFSGRALEDPARESRIYVEALNYESKQEFGESKALHERARLNRPLLPLEVDVFLRSKGDSKLAAPRGVGPVRINFRFADPPEDTSGQHASTAAEPSATRAYVDKALRLQGGLAGGAGDNCPALFDGIRGAAAGEYETPFVAGATYVPHVVDRDAAQKVVFSRACIDPKHSTRVGKAGVYFRPSRVAGDDYRLEAEIDFSGLPNQKQLEQAHGIDDPAKRIKVATGTLRVWRRARVAVHVQWPARSGSSEWDKIRAEFEKAWIELDVAGAVALRIDQVLTEKQYKVLVADHTSHKKKDVKLLRDSLVGVKLPAQGSLTRKKYRDALKTFCNDDYWSNIVYPLREQLSKNIRPNFPVGFVLVDFFTHRPVDVLKAPPGDKTVADAGYITWTSSYGLPDSTVFADMKDPDKVYYVVAHEFGHNFWLHHYEHAGGSKPGEHDTADHNCLMSYSSQTCAHAHHRQGTYTPHFCGKCNLRLRGWDIDAAGIPADSS